MCPLLEQMKMSDSSCCGTVKDRCPRPRGLLNLFITKGTKGHPYPNPQPHDMTACRTAALQSWIWTPPWLYRLPVTSGTAAAFQGIPTLLMAAGSFDDILAITGFSTCLGIAFSTGSTWMTIGKGLLEVVGGVISGLVVGVFLCVFPSNDQDLVLRRTLMLVGLSVFSVFFSHVVGFSGAGGLCTLVHSFCAALGWKGEKAPVAAMVGRLWDLFQPLLFGLIGAEITISTLSPSTVGLGMACISLGLLLRLIVTFLLVHYAGFNLKEKLFIAVAWLPKATVQAAIGSKALDMAREQEDATLIKFGLDVLTLAVLAILTTAPVGALGIGLAGPRLLARQIKGQSS
uniref:Cation/H+ exchanger transmembrane domain-containing protein n=1 Tax=Oryzias melastigma TaxID=30732 RepID=A0A3B3D6J6_ORYME